MEQRIKDLEVLLETEIRSARDHFRVGLESEALSRRQASDVHSSEVTRLSTAVETFGLRLAEEAEAREMEDRSLRECMEDLVEALKENMAKSSQDLSGVRDEVVRLAARSERPQLVEAIDGQLHAALRALEEKLREAMRLEHTSMRDANRSTFDALDKRLASDLARLSAEHGEHRTAHRTSMDDLEARLRDDIRGRQQAQALSNDTLAADHAALDVLELKWQKESERLSNSHKSDNDVLRGILSEHRNDFISQRDAYRSNFDKMGQDIARVSALLEEDRTRHRLNVEEMEAKIRAELSRTLAETRAEEKIRSELSRTLAETRADLNDVRDANTALHDRLRTMNQQNAGEQIAIETLDLRTREMEARLRADQRAALDEHRTTTRAALEAVESQLREEWLVIRDAVQSRGDAANRDDVNRVANEMKTVHELHRESVRAAMNELREEVDRLTGLGQEYNDSLRRLVSEKRDELQLEHDRKFSEQREVLRLLEAKLLEEVETRHGQLTSALSVNITPDDVNRVASEMKSVHELHRENVRAGMNELREEVDRLTGLGQEHNDNLRRLISEKRDELQLEHDRKFSEHREALRLLEAKLLEEIESRHGQLTSTQRMSLESLDAELRGEISRLGRSGGEVSLDHKTSLLDMEARLKAEMDGRHGHLDAAHRSGLESLDAILREEVAKVEALSLRSSTEQQKEHSALRDLMAEYRDDIRGKQDLTHEELRQNLKDLASKFAADLRSRSGQMETARIEAIDAKLIDEVSRLNSRVDSLQRTSLQALEADLREELARVSMESSKSHSTLRDLLSNHQSEIDSSHSRINSANRAVMAEADLKLEELCARCAKIESMQRSAIQTLGDELRDEMVRIQRNRGGPALEGMEARFESHTQRVESQLRRTTETVEEMLREEIGRLDGEHRARHGTLEELLLKCQRDVDELRLMPSREDTRSPRRDEYDVQRTLGSLVEGISCEDAEGRQWHFHHPRDCLQHMSRRLKELRVAIDREQALREASNRELDEVQKEVKKEEEDIANMAQRLRRDGSRERSRMRNVESELAVERELDWRQHEDARDIPRILVTKDASIGGLSSLPSSGSSFTTPVTNNTPVRASRLTAPTQQMHSSRSSTTVPNSTRSVSPSQRSMQSSRSSTAVGGGNSIMAGSAKSTRTASPKPSGHASRLQSRMGTGSSRPNPSPGPSRGNSTLKGSMRVRPAS